MKKHRRPEHSKLILLAVGLVVVSGCSSGIDRLERRLERMEAQQSDLRTLQAEQTTQLSALSTRVRELTGAVEELQYARRPRRVIQTEPPAPELPETPGEPSYPRSDRTPPAIVPLSALESDELLLSRLPSETARVFGNALVRIREGNFPEALPLLQRAHDSSRGEAYAANILFWIAVAHDGMGNNARALSTYHELSTNFAQHERTPLALLRQGSVFIRLGDPKTAELTFQKLVAEYPNSDESQRARERLRELR